MSSPASPFTIPIGRLADGPCPPTAANSTWPNVLHTRVGDLVTKMGPAPWSKRTSVSQTW